MTVMGTQLRLKSLCVPANGLPALGGAEDRLDVSR